MREWRNWQTRTFEGRVVYTVGFKSRFSHHSGVCCKGTTSETPIRVKITVYAGMAELADALDSGSSGGNFVEVQVLLPAPKLKVKLLGLAFYFCVLLNVMNLRARFARKSL